MDNEMVGLAEIAEIAGVSPQPCRIGGRGSLTFRRRSRRLRAGPVFDRHQVRRWLRKHKGERMAHVVSFINLKGGVGKTTTCVGVAEMLASDWAHGQKVLVIDLDPQTNATTMLIGEDRWEEANAAGPHARDPVRGRA